MTYPIVLAHGVCRFDILWNDSLNVDNNDDPEIDKLHYFKGIRTMLNDKGYVAYHSNVSWAAGVDTRAEDLKKNHKNFETKFDKEKAKLEKGLEEAEVGLISSALPNLVKGDGQAAERIGEIAKRIKDNAILSIPDFEAVPAMLDLDKLRTSTRLRIMTYVDFNNPKHKAIFTQISRSNILIRHSEEKNLWGINRDHEELLLAPRDSTGTPMGLVVKDAFQIEILGNILLEIWGKCRRNVDQYSFPE